MKLIGHPAWFLVLGGLLLLLGFGTIFSMVIGVVPPSYWLSFSGYGVSLTGLLIGVVGAVQLGERNRW